MNNKLILVFFACVNIGAQLDSSSHRLEQKGKTQKTIDDDSIAFQFWKSVDVLGLSGVTALSMSEESIKELTFVSSSTRAARVTVDDFERAKITLISAMKNPLVRLAQQVTLVRPNEAVKAEAKVDAEMRRTALLTKLRYLRSSMR